MRAWRDKSERRAKETTNSDQPEEPNIDPLKDTAWI
jgi:hypothetical protein